MFFFLSKVLFSGFLQSNVDGQNNLKYRDVAPLKCFFLRIECTCEETWESVWPPNASLYAISTCAHLRLLAGPFDQGLMVASFERDEFCVLK